MDADRTYASYSYSSNETATKIAAGGLTAVSGPASQNRQDVAEFSASQGGGASQIYEGDFDEDPVHKYKLDILLKMLRALKLTKSGDDNIAANKRIPDDYKTRKGLLRKSAITVSLNPASISLLPSQPESYHCHDLIVFFRYGEHLFQRRPCKNTTEENAA
jgi:hypothetical protein